MITDIALWVLQPTNWDCFEARLCFITSGTHHAVFPKVQCWWLGARGPEPVNQFETDCLECTQYAIRNASYREKTKNKFEFSGNFFSWKFSSYKTVLSLLLLSPRTVILAPTKKRVFPGYFLWKIVKSLSKVYIDDAFHDTDLTGMKTVLSNCQKDLPCALQKEM